jgi:hypothetical protein
MLVADRIADCERGIILLAGRVAQLEQAMQEMAAAFATRALAESDEPPKRGKAAKDEGE